MMGNHYTTLGVAKDADQVAIKAAWRKIALHCHPDRTGDDPRATDRFRRARKAYVVLIDPEQRSRYDFILGASALFACSCGRSKLPGSALCSWCGLMAYQEAERQKAKSRAAEKAQAKRAAAQAREAEDRAHFTERRQRRPPHDTTPHYSPGGSSRPAPAASASERSWDQAGEYLRGTGDGVVTPDVLLEGVVGHVAFQAAALGFADVRVEVGPDGRVRMSGGSVKDMERVRDSLGTATRLLSGIWGFLDRNG